MASSHIAPLSFDVLFKEAKSYGRYQQLFFVIVQYLCLPQAALVVSGFFSLGGLAPGYSCDDNELKFNISSKEVKANSASVCSLISNCTNLTAHNVWYSMHEEFRFVCQSDHLRSTIASILPIGYLFGILSAGHLIDYFGRKWLMIIGVIFEIAFFFAQALTPSWEFYVVLVVVHAFISSHGLYSAAAFSLIMESVHSKYRLVQSCAFQWCIGYIFAGFLAFLTRNWRYHILAANAMQIPALLAMLLLQESPRFLAQKGKLKEAASAMNKIARFNGRRMREFTESDIGATQEISENKKNVIKYTMFDLFRSKRLAKYAFSQIITGIGMNVIGSILLFNVHDLSGNPFVNVSLMGAARIWVPFLAIYLENGAKNFGRKRLLVFSQGLVCACFAAMVLISSLDLWERFQGVATGFALLGYGAEIGLVWFAYKLYTTELFPTLMRTTALCVFSTTSLVGSVLSPQLVYLSKFWHPAPYYGAAVIALLATVFAVLLLPETKGTCLPDTILEVENLEGKKTDEDNPKHDTAGEKLLEKELPVKGF